MITEPTLFIERKGIDGFEMPNALKIVMATNEEWAVPAGIEERRFAVFEVSNEFRQRNDHFKPLYAEIENGGAAAMMHELLALGLQGWHPREGIPQTEALRKQKLRSLDPEDEWWITILEQGWLPGTFSSDPALTLARSLYKHARRTVPRLRSFSNKRLSAILKDERHGAAKSELHGDKRLAGWRFPGLKGRRAEWADLLAGAELGDDEWRADPDPARWDGEDDCPF